MLEDGTRCHFSVCPPKTGHLQEVWFVLFCSVLVFFLLERIERLVDTRKAKGAGERGRTAELCSCVTVLLPKAGRVWFIGDTQKREGVWGAEQGEQQLQTPPQTLPPELQGSVSTCTDPLHKDQHDNRSVFPGHTHTPHRGGPRKTEKELTD